MSVVSLAGYEILGPLGEGGKNFFGDEFNQDLPVEDVVGHVDPPAYRCSMAVILATRSA